MYQPYEERLLQSEAWVQPVQLAQAESNVEEKTEQKTTTTDSAGLPEESKHVEHETNQSASDSTGAEAQTRHKAKVNESTRRHG